MKDTIHGITRAAVESSNIQSIGYSELRQVLAVEFKSGDVFHYRGVSEDTYAALLESDSLGKFYYQNIKGKFAAAKMTGPCPRCGSVEKGVIGETCEKCGSAKYVEVDSRIVLDRPEPDTEVSL